VEGTVGAATRKAMLRSATPAQIRAIHAMGNGQQLDVVTELQNRFGVERPDDLTVEQASQLIHAIRQLSNGIAQLG
jgi:hypothetical protein